MGCTPQPPTRSGLMEVAVVEGLSRTPFQMLSLLVSRLGDHQVDTVHDGPSLGPGEIIAVDNGDATSFEPFQSKERAAYNGLCLVVVRSKAGAPGGIKLRAYSEGLRPADVIPLETLRLGLRGDTLREILLADEPAPAQAP